MNQLSSFLRWGAGAAVASCLVIPVGGTVPEVNVRANDIPVPLAAVVPCEPSWQPAFGKLPATDEWVGDFVTFDDGSGAGPALYAGGNFTTVGGSSAHCIGRWDGTSWAPLGSGMDNYVWTMTTFDDRSGAGTALYAGGTFTKAGGVAASFIARWDGTSWSPLGRGMDNYVWALTTFDDGSGGGPALYAAGRFTVAGGVAANYVARWNGLSWSPLGRGVDAPVYALTTYDDGSGAGPALYAGGRFRQAGGADASYIARWDGRSWSPVGRGVNGHVFVLATFDDGLGGGPALFAAGRFMRAGETAASHVARWDGTSWSPLGRGLDGWAYSLATFDDGTGAGPALYVGGYFVTAGGITAECIARWDGSSWSALGRSRGLDGHVFALEAFNDGSGVGPKLFAGGEFSSAGGTPANHVAVWAGCGLNTPGDINGDGAVDAIDLGILMGDWGSPGAGDINGDGTTDNIDIGILLGAWTG